MTASYSAGGPRPHGIWWQEVATTATTFARCLLGGVMRDDGTLSLLPVAAYVIAVVSCAVVPLRHKTPRRVAGRRQLLLPDDLHLKPLEVA